VKPSPRQLLALLRVYLYGVLAGLIVFSVLSPALNQLRADNQRLVSQTVTDEQQIGQLQAVIDDLRSRWIGDPALWQPTGVPAHTDVEYFDVTGTTQSGLINALDSDGLCQKYGCLPDPALPNNTTAWALEGDGYLEPSSAYCYTPRSVTYRWQDHTIYMPRWSPKPGTVKITLVQAWNALEGVMFTHEAGHVQVSEDWLASMNAQAEALATCQSFIAFWDSPHLYDSLNAAQNAYHAKLRADCRPEVGCIPSGWMGW
jgi:hypothetical protein